MNAVEYIYKMFSSGRRNALWCAHLRVATNSFHIVLYCCTSFIISPLATVRKTTFLGAFLKSFQDKNLREQSLIGKLEVIGYVLLGFPGFQEIGISLLAIAKKVSKRPWLGGYCTLDWKNTQKYLKFFWKQLAIPNHIGNRGKSI